MRARVTASLGFLLKGFAVPAVFFLAFRAYGAKAAIGTAIVFTVTQLLVQRWRQLELSPFFIVSSGFTIAFGIIDLMLASPKVFRFEPFAQNLLMALVFAASLFTRKSLIEWFSLGLPARFQPSRAPEHRQRSVAYMRRLTWVWAGYSFAKAFAFLALAYRVDLGQLIVLRTVFGGGSAVLLVAGEILYRQKWRDRRQTAVVTTLSGPESRPGLRHSGRNESNPPGEARPSSG